MSCDFFFLCVPCIGWSCGWLLSHHDVINFLDLNISKEEHGKTKTEEDL